MDQYETARWLRPLFNLACLLGTLQPISTAMIWALGVALMLRTLFDIAVPLALRDSRQDMRSVATASLWAGLAGLAYFALRPSVLTIAADVQRMRDVLRLCCAGAGLVLVLRSGLRLAAKWANPAGGRDHYITNPLLDFQQNARAWQRHLTYKAFRQMGGGDFVGFGVGLLLCAVAACSTQSASACAAASLR